MARTFICDGCGNEAAGFWNGRNWFKPELWFERGDDDGPQLACSRTCIEKIAAKSGKTAVVLPF
jgi:hypothetical protein